MPRPARYPLSEMPLLVLQRGNNGQPVFFCEGDFRFYLACLTDAAHAYRCDVHAYVLMPSCVQLLLTPHQRSAIGKIMQSIGRTYVQHINSTLQRSGTLWEGRYRACLIEPASYLMHCYRYIELEPVRHRLANDPMDYLWSSYHWHASGKRDPVITDHPLYLTLAGTEAKRCSVYRQTLDARMDRLLTEEIGKTLNQCRVLGSERFKDDIEGLLARRVRQGKRGRPKKVVMDVVEKRIIGGPPSVAE
jgi:putative transposase